MPIFLQYIMNGARRAVFVLAAWRFRLLLFIGVLFFATWLLMWWAEPGNDLVKPQNYFYWFVVSVTTVGYGDMYAKTGLGHLIGANLLLCGVAMVGVVIGQVSNWIIVGQSRRLKGLVKIHVHNHVIILGWDPANGPALFHQLQAEGTTVVVADDPRRLGEHPMPGESGMHFACAPYTDAALLDRANLITAQAVIINAPDADAVVLARRVQAANPAVHLVVMLTDLGLSADVAALAPGAAVVTATEPEIAASEALNPGVSTFLMDLLSRLGGENPFRAVVPDAPAGLTVGSLQAALKQRGNALVVGVGCQGCPPVNNPPWSTPLRGGDVVYYVDQRALRPAELAAACQAVPATI
jgi:voltage-gated potassium channel